MDQGIAAHHSGRIEYSETGRQLLYLVLGIAVIILSVSGLALSLPFGFASTFVLTFGIVTLFPASAPVIVLVAFMLQNWVIAAFTGIVPDDAAFDALRGANFIILMTAYGAFLLASFQHRATQVPQLKGWLLASLGLLVLVLFYTALGAVAGTPRDAIVYFRNTIGWPASIWPSSQHRSIEWILVVR